MTTLNKEDARQEPNALGHLTPVALWIGGICIVVDLVRQAADLGLIGSSRWRSLAYQNGAVWPGLLRGWQANYSAQPALMFVTYAFLHGGFWHLAGNMLALVLLGRIASNYVGQKAFVLIYGMSALGGAVAFGVMAQGAQPMVGASGALFGLVGAWQYWDYADPRCRRRRIWCLARVIGILAALNLVPLLVFDGAFAWQTHLGGILTGWATARLLRRRHAACRI